MTIRDLKLDPDTLEPVVENGDLVEIFDLDVVAQRHRLTLGCFLGEWFLDTTHGVDYFGQVLGKGVQQARVASHLRSKILAIPNTNSLNRFEFDYEPETRKFSLDYEAETDFGPLPMSQQLPPAAS